MRSTQQLRKRRHAATKRQGWGLKQAEGPEGRCLHVPRPLTDAPWMGHTGLPSSSAGKESACNARDQSDPWVGKIPWRRERLPAPVLLPGEVHGQRSLVGSSPWGHKELDVTEQLSLFHTVHPAPAPRWHSLVPFLRDRPSSSTRRTDVPLCSACRARAQPCVEASCAPGPGGTPTV